MNSTKKVEAFYDSDVQREWERMDRHPLEFGVTMRYMNEHYPESASILDVGGGPGKYSIALNKKGFDVTLVDLSPKNIEYAKQKAKELNADIKAICVNALDLDKNIDGKFDIVQCMGPLYHLVEKSDRISVVNQCLSLLKPDGLFIASFISSYAFLADMITNYPQEVSQIKDYVTKINDNIQNIEGDKNPGFTDAYFTYPLNIEPFFDNFGLETIVVAGIEGLPMLGEPTIRDLPADIVNKWIDIAYKTSQDKLTWGASQHFLYIGRKT